MSIWLRFMGILCLTKICVTELKIFFSNIIPNSWSKQAYVQGFYCESISLKKDVNMFEKMNIVESIY